MYILSPVDGLPDTMSAMKKGCDFSEVMSKVADSRPPATQRYFAPGTTGVADSDSMRTKCSAAFTNRIVPAQSTGVAAGGRGFDFGRSLFKPSNHDLDGDAGFLPGGWAHAPSKKTTIVASRGAIFIKEARLVRVEAFWQKRSIHLHCGKSPIDHLCEREGWFYRVA